MSTPLLYLVLLLALASVSVNASPLRFLRRQAPATLDQKKVDDMLLRPALFSRVAYCDPDLITKLTCGDPCKDLSADVEVLQTGGDNDLVPVYYVAHDRTDNSIVVSHQGTDSKSILSILNDAQFGLDSLDGNLYPEASKTGAKVHSGFQKTFQRTAESVRLGVEKGLKDKNSTKVLITGHSLGAAMAIMDAMMLKDVLDPSIEMRVITFGTPRSGNKAWADLVDAELKDNYKYVTNKDDVIPRLPPTKLDFRHSSGEIHINNDAGKDIVSCPGQENEDAKCSNGDGDSGGRLFGLLPDVNIDNHGGPYINDISFGSSACPRP